jgi:hypothetical protein
MTGKPLAVTQKQITAILKGAAKAGLHLKIKAREGEVVFITDEENGEPAPEIPPVKKRPSFDI